MPQLTDSLGRVAILGGNGLLGGDLAMFFKDVAEVIPIDTDNYDAHRGEAFDIFVNANGNSRRFWADEHPLEDFDASTRSVYCTFMDFKAKKYIYISSSDVYPDHSTPRMTDEGQEIEFRNLTPYGFHKYLAEQIVKNHAKDFIILRSSMMLGTKLRKGPIFDILNGTPLFITKDTRLQMISTRVVADAIVALLRANVSREVFNMGGVGVIDFKEIESISSRTVQIAPEAKRQEYEMNVEKISRIIPLKASREYLVEFFANTH